MTTETQRARTQTLLTEFSKGSDAAFAELYEMYVQPLYTYGLRMTHNEELLKDCIQEVFLKVYSKRSEQTDIKNFASYLVISMKNRLLDAFRHQSFCSDNEVECYAGRAADCDVEQGYLLIEDELMQFQQVAALMQCLTPRQREAITLYYLEGRKYPEVCERMQMNYHSVRNLMHRGMLKLRESAGVLQTIQ